jgi:hypothetical protein
MTDRTIRITGPLTDSDLVEIMATLRRLDLSKQRSFTGGDQKTYVVTIVDAGGGMDEGERLIRELLPPLPERTTAFARAAYHDNSFPQRPCERCGKPYCGPAVYCSLTCALADA